MKRISKYQLKNGTSYKFINKRLSQTIILKILSEELQLRNVKIYSRTDYGKTRDISGDMEAFIVFEDDIIYELSEQELFLETI